MTLFVERGYFGTSVHDIVGASNVSIGSIYHHFGDKAGIARALRRADRPDGRADRRHSGPAPGRRGALPGDRRRAVRPHRRRPGLDGVHAARQAPRVHSRREARLLVEALRIHAADRPRGHRPRRDPLDRRDGGLDLPVRRRAADDHGAARRRPAQALARLPRRGLGQLVARSGGLKSGYSNVRDREHHNRRGSR
ncbi:MAG: helix-turn-helix transcriptional regulator [Steroidobacteraceae bacterium]|nr:helix-turn-helix transcriptional regulator [Steroidobacteraceae bacterium]